MFSPNGTIKVDVFVNDKPVTEYPHMGDTFIEGRSGSEYYIRISNMSHKNIKAIVSVDGLCVLDGTPASDKSLGFVINAGQNIKVAGWQTSSSIANKFFFGNKSVSYANRTDQSTSNVGVIGVMTFDEEYQYDNFYSSSFGGNSFGAAIPLSYNSRGTNTLIGTGFGQQTSSVVKKVDMKFSRTYSNILALFYDDRKGLERRGIVLDPHKSSPNPFPGYGTSYARIPTK